ncbi:hypothetical protein LP420_40280 [Massilia sp. B-10]|nr:hypothetical protein LP420_40280 [Massilia sp. B-10]
MLRACNAVGQVNIIDAYANANVQAYSLLLTIGVPIATAIVDENNLINLA